MITNCLGCKKIIKKSKSSYCFYCYWKFNSSHKKGKKTGKFTIEHRKKISESLKGSKHQYWKGEDVSYKGLHDWINRNYGKPKKCEFCGTTSAKKFEWASKNHQYKREISDWFRLCTSCHRKYDFQLRKNIKSSQENYYMT